MKGLLIVVVLLASMKFYSQVDKIRIEKDSTCTIVDERPQYPGGFVAMMKFFNQNISLTMCTDSLIGGCNSILLNFRITKFGKLDSVKVLRGLRNCTAFDMELIRIFESMPLWIPGKKNGVPVNYYFNLPIRIRIG